jgi:hypothetical protein
MERQPVKVVAPKDIATKLRTDTDRLTNIFFHSCGRSSAHSAAFHGDTAEQTDAIDHHTELDALAR